MSNYENWKWQVGVSGYNGIPCVDAVCPETGQVIEICEVWGEDDDREVTPFSIRNAHLIAAAPDMYEALEEMLADGIWSGCYWIPSDGAKQRAEAVLAKARGKS